MEDEESLEEDEAEEYIDDMKLDEARAEERDEDWQEREFAKLSSISHPIAESRYPFIPQLQRDARRRRKRKNQS